MSNRKQTYPYYFSVEGQTEKWYLEKLQELINSCDDSYNYVKFDSIVSKDPIKYAKETVTINNREIWYLCDIESNAEEYIKRFRVYIDRLHEAKGLRKGVFFKLGYSNLTFELWIILHKLDYNVPLSHRNGYLQFINKAYHEDFGKIARY